LLLLLALTASVAVLTPGLLLMFLTTSSLSTGGLSTDQKD
jgi:threonine/homoserine/homoserine lactone efflux protein